MDAGELLHIVMHIPKPDISVISTRVYESIPSRIYLSDNQNAIPSFVQSLGWQQSYRGGERQHIQSETNQ